MGGTARTALDARPVPIKFSRRGRPKLSTTQINMGELPTEKHTHESLRKFAVKWLSASQRCSVVLSELVSAAAETPDAVGWRFGSSILVECKVSRSDFHANKNKPSVRSERGA